jgi:hypothetical protein
MTTKFEMPEIKGKTLAPKSISIYRSKLNKLASADIKNIQELLENSKMVIEMIDSLPDASDTTKENTEKRAWMSAIDYALFDTPIKQKKAYMKYYDSLWPKTGTKIGTNPDGSPKLWKSRVEYFEELEKAKLNST